MKQLPGRLDPELILVSPMRRTLQTAVLALDWLMENGVRSEAHAAWQETSHHPCNVGSPIDTMKEEFPVIDFSHVDPVFPDRLSPEAVFYEWSKKAILHRAQVCLKDLAQRPEKVILVVSHAAFMANAVTGCAFGNADYRIFDFEEPESEQDTYRLKEWHQTRETHGGMGWSWDVMVELGHDCPETRPAADE